VRRHCLRRRDRLSRLLSSVLVAVLEEDGGGMYVVDRECGDASVVLVVIVFLLVQEDDDGNDGDCRLSRPGGGGTRFFVALESQLDTLEGSFSLCADRNFLFRLSFDTAACGGTVDPKKASS